VLTAQEIVGEIESAEHVEAASGDADGGECVVVHERIVAANICFSRANKSAAEARGGSIVKRRA
jgi:hypothetical protein